MPVIVSRCAHRRGNPPKNRFFGGNCSSTSAAFTFTAKTSHNGNYYRCRVKDNGGNTVYSSKVKLTVK